MLELRGVSTKYGGLPVLAEISIKVNKAETVCILGANGAGKTTILKTIIGMVRPVNGEIYYKGERVDLLPSHKIIRSGIAIVPEREGLFPKLSVEKNILMGGYYEKDSRAVRRRFEDVLAVFPRLKDRLRFRAGTLSGGERKMLGIARALVADPLVLLMDEPSLGLAPSIVNEVFSIIERIKREKRLSILLVEQNAQKALSVADRGYVLQKGSIIFDEPSDKLEENPFIRESYLATFS